MKILHRLRFIAAATAFSATVFSANAATLASNGSRADVQARINSAVNGDIVTIPAGTFTWTSTVTITGKAIQLRGEGAGRVVARIAAPNGSNGTDAGHTVATGTKVFTLKVESVAAIAALRSQITNGRTLRVNRLGPELVNINRVAINDEPWMEGTVTSLSGDTLTMNITSVNYGVYSTGLVHPMWTVSTLATTTIVSDTTPSETDYLINIAESTAGSVEMSGLRFTHSTGSGSYWQQRNYAKVTGVTNGYPVLLHDCYFEVPGYAQPIHWEINRGVIWNCSFRTNIHFPGAIAFVLNLGPGAAAQANWSAASTMGTADTTGKNNFYMEDSDFHGYAFVTDLENGSRSVFRHCLWNNGGVGSHGADTGSVGLRHFELYDNEFVYNGYNSSGYAQSCNMTRLIWVRGGTGVITDNIIPPGGGWDYGATIKSIELSILNINRNSGPNPFWGKDITGVQYHSPRQVGFGNVTGLGRDGRGRSTDAYGYVGDIEPLYIWNNAGGYTFGLATEGPGPGEDNVAAYLRAGIEYFNNVTAKPGWTKPTGNHPAAYPHSLRGAPRFVQIAVSIGS